MKDRKKRGTGEENVSKDRESPSDEIFPFALAHCILQVNISLKGAVKVFWVLFLFCLVTSMRLFVLVEESTHDGNDAKDDEYHYCYYT